MADGVEVKLDINQLITQVAQGFSSAAASSTTSSTLCKGGRVVGVQDGINWSTMTGWADQKSVRVASIQYDNNGSRLGIWSPNTFDLICSYQAGGGFQGKGKFLQNIRFELKVTEPGGLGTGGSITGSFDDPANRGTADDPVAELVAHIKASNGNDLLYKVTFNGTSGCKVESE